MTLRCSRLKTIVENIYRLTSFGEAKNKTSNQIDLSRSMRKLKFKSSTMKTPTSGEEEKKCQRWGIHYRVAVNDNDVSSCDVIWAKSNSRKEQNEAQRDGHFDKKASFVRLMEIYWRLVGSGRRKQWIANKLSVDCSETRNRVVSVQVYVCAEWHWVNKVARNNCVCVSPLSRQKRVQVVDKCFREFRVLIRFLFRISVICIQFRVFFSPFIFSTSLYSCIHTREAKQAKTVTRNAAKSTWEI